METKTVHKCNILCTLLYIYEWSIFPPRKDILYRTVSFSWCNYWYSIIKKNPTKCFHSPIFWTPGMCQMPIWLGSIVWCKLVFFGEDEK